MVLLLVLLAPARVGLRLAGDPVRGIEVTLSWRLLILHGARSRRLDFGKMPSSQPTIAARAAPAELAGARAGGAAHAATAASHAPAAPAGRRLGDAVADAEHALDVVHDLLARHAIRVSSVGGWLELALADVGETGRIYGLSCALATLLDPHGRLELRPRWDAEDWLAADLALELGVQPLQTAWILLRARRARAARSRSHKVTHASGGVVAT